jgi:hypothetical protein
MKKYCWFTLIEIVMVLVVISILMTVTLKFGADRVKDLNDSTLKNQSLDAITAVLREHSDSNYHEGQAYDSMDIVFVSWADTIGTEYMLWGQDVMSWIVILPAGVHLAGPEHLTVSAVPYTLWCLTKDISWPILLSLDIANDIACYTLDTQTCKLYFVSSCDGK